jgi:hypothetical protein
VTTSISSGAIIPVANLAPSKYADDATFDSLASGGGFLPRLMLMNSTSELVKEDKMKQGYYALVRSKNSFVDLTKEVVILPVQWRPKALEITKEGIVSIFNPKSPEFLRIAKKSEIPNSQAMFGPEFLCWLPSERCFMTYYMASKTARRVSNEVKVLIGYGVLLKSALIKGKNNSWFGPVVMPSSAPMSDVPTTEDIERYVADFNNPAEKSVDVAQESGRAH